MLRNNTSALKGFIKDECANYDKHYQSCIWDRPCMVLSSARCGYFEKVVLCPAGYKFRLPDYDYQKLSAQYTEQTRTQAESVNQRLCGCGNPLRHRQRFCDDCTQKRRKDTNRKHNRKRVG